MAEVAGPRALDELLDLARRQVEYCGARRIVRAFVPEPNPDPARDAEFGLLELDDGSAGLYYAWIGDSQQGMARRFPPESLVGRDACELACAFAVRDADDARRSLALAALNALTASLWAAADFHPPPAASSFGLTLAPGDALGMIGNFPSLVRQARALDIPVTVVERKAHMVTRAPGLRITLDPRALAACNRIVCTAATLLNDTFDEMLGQCPSGADIAVVGPTAGCCPDPLFARGVATVGGTLITDPQAAAARLAAGAKLGDCGMRYALTPATTPPTRELIERAARRVAAARR